MVVFFFPCVLFCFSHWSLARSFASVTIPIYSVVSFFSPVVSIIQRVFELTDQAFRGFT